MSSFCKCKSYSLFIFSKKFNLYTISNDQGFNDITNDIVNFEQLGPELEILQENKWKIWTKKKKKKKKNVSSFCKCKSYSLFIFSKKFNLYTISNDQGFNDITNDIVNFEQLGPELEILQENKWKIWSQGLRHTHTKIIK